MTEKLDVICAGLAVVDIFIKTVPEDILSRNEYRVSEIGSGAGGDAVNETIMLQKLGVRTGLMARLGMDDMGDMLMSYLENAGIETSFITRSKNSKTATSVILVKEDGQRSILSIKGNNTDFCKEDISSNMPLPDAKALSIASLFGLPGAEEDGSLENLLRYAKEKGMITFADMGMDKQGKKLGGIKRFLPYIDYFVPSLYDAEGLTEKGLPPEKMADIFHDCGAKNVIIKMGEQGVFASDGKKTEKIPAFKVDAVDTTGAGDTFCAGLIRSIIKGLPLFDACLFACAAAAFSTQYLGASSAPIDEHSVLDMIKNGKK